MGDDVDDDGKDVWMKSDEDEWMGYIFNAGWWCGDAKGVTMVEEEEVLNGKAVVIGDIKIFSSSMGEVGTDLCFLFNLEGRCWWFESLLSYLCLFLITSVFIDKGLFSWWSFKYKPHALQRGDPSSLRLQSGVVVVEQLEHTNWIASSSFVSFLELWGFNDFGLGTLCNFWLFKNNKKKVCLI